MAKNMDIDIQEVREVKKANIVVIGVGGAGSNMVSYLYECGAHPDLTLIVANTDNQHLSTRPVPNKIQLGEQLTGGRGAGADDEIGKKAAEESSDEIKRYLSGANMVIICAGLGGGTGTGAAPIVAKIAKEFGALTVAIATKPFKTEGSNRVKAAKRGYEALNELVDSLLVVPNEKLLAIAGKNAGWEDVMNLANSVLARAARGISNVILEHGKRNDTNVDFADVCRVMTYKGLAIMGIGEGKGNQASLEALRNAMESPLFDNLSIHNAKGVILNFEMNSQYPFMEVHGAMEYVYEAVNADSEEGDIIYGTLINDDLPLDFIRITLIATGLEKAANDNLNASSDNSANSKKEVGAQTNSVSAGNIGISIDGLLRVSGGDDGVNLDEPAFMRHKKD